MSGGRSLIGVPALSVHAVLTVAVSRGRRTQLLWDVLWDVLWRGLGDSWDRAHPAKLWPAQVELRRHGGIRTGGGCPFDYLCGARSTVSRVVPRRRPGSLKARLTLALPSRAPPLASDVT